MQLQIGSVNEINSQQQPPINNNDDKKISWCSYWHTLLKHSNPPNQDLLRQNKYFTFIKAKGEREGLTKMLK